MNVHVILTVTDSTKKVTQHRLFKKQCLCNQSPHKTRTPTYKPEKSKK